MEDKRDILYKNLLGSGRVSENEIGTLDQFKSAIKDEGTARQFHKNLLGAGFTSDEIGSDDDFYNSISSDFDPKHDTVMAHSVNPNWEQGVVPAVAASKTENKPAITSVDNKTAAPVHQEVFGQSINPEWNQHILSPYTGKKEMEDFSDKPTFQTYDNVRDYYAGKFSMTEEGKAAQGEIAEIEKDLVDTMIGRMKQSDEYKAIIASDAAPGDKDKTLQAIWERDYQPEVDKFMQPFINEYGEKILNRYGQSMKDDYYQLDKDNTSASWEGINNRIEKAEAELDKAKGGWKNIGRPTFESVVSKNDRDAASMARNEKVRQISAARSMMERSQKIIQAANDNKDGTFVGGVARGFRDETFNLDNWTFGVKGMRDGKACIDVMEKYERGEKLTKEEEILMDALASGAATQAYFSSELGKGYKYGSVTGASLPFMLDMVTGMGLVSGATKAASKGLMKWIAKEGLQAVAKGITDSAIHTATFGAARVGENYLDRAKGNAKFDIDNEGNVHYAGREGMETGAGALGKAFASTALETQSELIGAQFGPALNFVGKQMMRIPGIRNIPASKIGKLAKEYSGSAAGKMLKDFTSKTQFHGALGEYAEEVYNNIGSTLLGDMTPEQLVSLDQNLDTFLSVSVMSAAFGTVGTAAFIREKYKTRKNMRDFEKVMRDNMDYDAIKESLKDADIEGAKTFIKEVMSDKSLSPEERKEEIEYIVDVLKESVMGSAEQEIGKESLSNEEIEANKAAIVTEFEQARKNLESAVPPEILSMVDAGQDISSMSMSEEQEMAVADYIAAKSGMDDYMNSVDNKVTEAKMEARREVEGVSNPDMGAVVRVTRRGSDVPINIVGGKITFDEEGLIDKENSDDIIYYVDENGKRKQGTPGDFEKLVDSTDTEAVAQQAEADAEQQVLDEEQAQLPQPYMPQPGEEVVLPNGYRGTVAGMQDSETVIVSNGESTVAARLDEVQPANQAQPVIESPVSSTQQAQPVEEKNESVTDSSQEPEQPAEEPKSTAMPMVGEGEDMEPDFKSVDPQRTYDYLYGEEGGLTPEEASAFVDANIAEKQKAVEKFSSKAPKMGTSLVKYRKAQAEWKAQAEAAQKELDYWNSVKSKRDEVKAAEAEEARKVKAGEEVASVVREMGEPMNGEELAASMLANGAINLRRDEFTKETGYGNAEASKLFGLFRTKDNGGVSLQEAGELVMQADREAGTNFFDQNDPNAGRNAILDVLASSTTPSDLRNFIKNNREAQAKKEEQAERDYFDGVIQSSYHMTLEEFELYNEVNAEKPYKGVDLAELDAIFAEPINYNDYGQTTEQRGIAEQVEGSERVLPPSQPGNTGSSPEINQEWNPGEGGAVAGENDGSIQGSISGEQVNGAEEAKSTTTGATIDGGILDIATSIAKEQDRQDVRDQVNTEPSEAQKEAGNYKMGHLKVDGLDVSIENPKGSTRRGKDANGTEWSVTMYNDYGYIRRTEGADGDHVDVFLSDNPEQGDVFVVDQVKADGSFDEHKVMYGFNSEEEARAAYLANYSPGWKGLGAITRASKEEFKEWVKDGAKKSVPFSDTNVKPQGNAESVTIKPAQYTTKKGKVLDMQLVTPASQLDKEQVKQATKFAKDKRGWYDFAKGGFMMRSEEDAKEMASFIEKMNAPEKKVESVEAPKNEMPDESEDSAYSEETKPEVQASQLSTWKANATPINTDGSYDIILNGEQEYITITKDFGNGVYVADAVNSRGEKHQFIDITEEQIRKGIALMLDKDASSEKSPKDEPEKPVEKKRWKYSLHVDKTSGYTTIKRDDVSGDIPITDGNWKIKANSPEEMLEILSNTRNNTQELLDEFGVTLKNKIAFRKIAEEEKKAKEAKPAESSYGSNNKMVTNEQYEALKARMKKKLNQLNMGMDPEMIEIGTMMAVYHFEAGARKFADYAKHMIDDCGDGIRPYLKSFYNAIRDYPGINDVEMTPYDEVRTFDVANFDKTGTDVIALAEQIANEQEVEKKVEKVKKTSKTGKKKKQDSSIGDLFGSQEAAEQTDNTISETQKEENNGQEVQLQTGSSTSEREGRHQPGQNEPVGKSEQHEAEGPDGRRMGGRDSVYPVSDTQRSGSVSGPLKSKSSVEVKPKNTRNNVSERGHDYAPKSDKARVDANIKALEIMNRLIESGQPATREDMEALRQFSGWGGLGGAFKERIGNQWSAENPINKKLRELLTPEQYEWASGSASASQYFTPAFTIDAMWDIARSMGFKGGNVLEGSAGIGNILGLMPRDLSEKSSLIAVEKDEAVGQMLSLLYPDAKVEIKGFEEAKIENGSVDLAITNVPFVTGLKVFDTSGDTDLSRMFRDIHNFCIAKNIRKLRQGGIGIFISSSGTMDKSPKLMNWIISEGNSDVVGAFRLNSNTFGGTNATSDIIVVRKRVNGKKSSNAIDVSKSGVLRVVPYVPAGSRSNTKPKDMALDMNQYYIEHPENLGGEMAFAFEKGETYQETSKRLYPSAEVNQEKRLASWVDSFKDMNWEASAQREDTRQDTSVIYEDLGEDVKEGSMLLDSNGELCLAQRGKAVPIGVNKNKVKGKTKAECFKDYKAIKDALSAVLEYQTTHESDKELAPLLKELNRAYDDFVNTYGHLNKNVSISFLKADMDFPSIAALENVSEKGRKDGKRDVVYSKTDVFKKRVVDKESEPEPQNVKDGIIASIYLHGRVDVPYIAEQLGKTKEEVRSEIVKSGLGFENPTTTDIDVSYEYLSGNVREKLKIAKDANTDGRYDANVKALEAVVPMNIPAHLVQFSLGSSWVDPKLYTDYVLEKTEVKVGLTNAGGTWVMSKPHYVDYEKNKAMGVRSEICNKIVLGHVLIEAAMQNRTISVTRTIKHYNGETETIVDKDATMACSNKIDEIRQNFKEWARKKMQSDPELSQEIERIYNDQFNNYVPKEISNEFIPEHFGGAASTINGVPFNLRKHQAKAAIRATTQPLMLAHEVGTGKTFTLITTAMEMRRLGTARKPMIVVQNATVGQFVGSAKSLYPNARILTLEDADRTSEGRKNFYAKIRYNDWDMIVVPQSVFERIPDSPEREARFVQDKIEEKMRVIEQLREDADNDRDPAVRRAEKELESLQDELNEIHLKLSSSKSVDVKDSKDKKREAKAKQNAAVKAQEMLDRETDDTMDFDDMGIDALLIDEAHEYKHLGFETAMQRGVKGVDPSYSKKSQGVYLKTQAVLENNKGRNVVFATGTPISNTAAEIWTFMRYLMPADVMKSYDIFYFDDFVRNFGQIEQIPEFGASGKYKEVNRFNGYINLPELERIWLGVADTVLTKQAGGVSDKIPAMEGDKAQDVYLPQTKSLRSVMKYVKERLNAFENMTGKEKRENSHIPLVMYGIAKAAAVDTRLVLNDAPDETNSKTNETVRQTLKSLKETKSYNGTVAIFADNYQNKKNGFNLYEDIRAKLIKQGVPDKQIIIMRSGMSVKKKLEIFDQVNRGEVRVIMGSTFTLGTGVNIQERLHTLIHVDAPVRPMDYTQRNGRILRQGNLHKEWDIPVRVLRFGVEDSLDVTAYQRLKTKGAIADSIMNGQKLIEDSMNNRVLEEEQDIFGDITAQLSGSEYALLKNQAEKQLKKLESRYSQWEQDQMYIHNEKPRLKGLMNEARRRKEEAESALSKVEAIKDKTIHIGKQQFVNVDAMADFIKDYNIKQREAQEKVRTSSGDKVVSRLPVVIGGYEFVIDSETSREIKHTSSGMVTSASTKMRYSCKELGLDGLAVDGQKIKNAINDILDDIISGNDFREIIDVSDAAIKRHENGLKQLGTREGKPFEEAEALEQAKAKVEEYEELMKKELEEKEAKYAEIDKEVEAASGVEGVEEDEDSDEGLRFREDDEEESDKKTPFTDQPNRANEKPVSGSVPASIHRDSSSNPMASKQADAKIDKDTQSTKSKLRKFFNGDYHVDSSSLNKTFVDLGKMLSMQDKGGSRYSVLRTNTGDIVAIRLSDHLANGNNFKRDNADSNLSIVIERHVYGTQGESDIEYTEAVIKQETFNQKPEEVIKAIVNGVNNVLEGKEFSLDPSIGEVRSEMSLLNREGEGTYTDKELSYLNDPISIFMGKNRFPKKRQESYAGKVRVRMKERAKGLAELLNLDNVEILEDTEGLKGRKARAKGWFDPNTGKIVVVVPNHKSTYDIQQTVLHEAVAHYGLRKLFGKHFNDFLDNVYNNASAEIRGRIAHRAVEKKWDIREATEEYLADLAEHTNFENAQSEGWFQQIKNFFIRMLAKAGIRLDAELTDNELRYILWRSFGNLTNPGGRRSIIDEAKDIATQYELGVGNYEGSESSRNRVAETRFRDGDDGSIRAYEESLKGVKYKFQEAYQDSMLALKHLQEVVAKTSGKPIQAFEDAYMAENHLSGKNTDEARRYYEAYFKPLEKEIAKITKGDTKGYEELSDYLILKHGVERNIEYSMRAFFRGLEGKMEEEEIEQYYSDYQSAKNALRKNVEDGTISEADYLQELEAIALEYVDTIDDYSGTCALLGRMVEAKMPDGVAEKDKTAHYLDKFNSVYGKEANMQELAREAIAKYENTHDVSSLWEKVNKATKYGLRKAYDSGMMSRGSYHHVDGMFRYYVPLRGWDEKTADDVYEYLGSEISPVNSVLKTAKGRKSIPDNPLPVIGNMAESAIIQGNRNMMKQSFLNMVQNHPTDVATLKKAWYVLDEVTGEWYVSYPDIEAHDTADDIADKVHDHELRMEELESKGLATQKRGKLNINYRINKGQAKEHVVNVKRNGQDYVIYVNGNPRAAQALNGMTNPDAVTSKPLQAWNAANRWLAANFTTRNPAFVLSNISRDLIFAQSAVMVKESPEYAGKFFVNAGKAMSVVMRNINGKGSESNEMDRYFREFVENGGETGYMHLTDVDQYRKKIKRDLERLSGKEVKAKAAARYCIDRLEDFNRWAEDVSRFAAYATSRQMGRSIQESVRDAKEVTVNFNKKGAGFKTGGFIGYSAGVMHGLYLFFKVGIQSLVNFGRLAMKNPGKMGAMLGSFAATGVLVPAVINPMLYALLGGAGDDDPYKNLSEWERRNNLCIYCGGGGFIKVPLPIELRAFYGLGEMSYDYMTRKTRVRPEEAAFALANQITELLPLNPLGNNGDIVATLLPDVLQPFYEVSQNKDYAGRPVYNETPFNELDPEFKRTYKGTSGWLVDVSKYLNEATRGNDFKKGEVDFNPAKIEHIYEYYLGGMGKTINQLGKTLWYGAKSIANGEKDENLVLRNVPVVNRFLSFPDEKNANAGINKEYFRMVDEWKTLDHELNELAKKGTMMNPKYLQQYIDLTNSDQYKWYKAFESFKKSLDGLYQMRKAIPDEEMQKQVDEQMMVLKRQAIDEMEKFSK